MRYWTSDLHLGHANINLYCKRPMLLDEYVGEDGKWVGEWVKHMCGAVSDNLLICNMNGVICETDTVYHVGDFCFKTSVKPFKEWQEELRGHWVHFTGNHDENNGVRYGIDTAVVSIGGYKAFVQHRPIERNCEVPDFCDFVICGHVHELWRVKKIDGHININVGVDSNKFMPLTDSDVLGLYTSNKDKL